MRHGHGKLERLSRGEFIIAFEAVNNIDLSICTFNSAVPSSNRVARPTKTRRPRNAFILFRSYAIINKLLPEGITHQNVISKEAGKLWKRLSSEEREPFLRSAKEEKLRLRVEEGSDIDIAETSDNIVCPVHTDSTSTESGTLASSPTISNYTPPISSVEQLWPICYPDTPADAQLTASPRSSFGSQPVYVPPPFSTINHGPEFNFMSSQFDPSAIYPTSLMSLGSIEYGLLSMAYGNDAFGVGSNQSTTGQSQSQYSANDLHHFSTPAPVMNAGSSSPAFTEALPDLGALVFNMYTPAQGSAFF